MTCHKSKPNQIKPRILRRILVNWGKLLSLRLQWKTRKMYHADNEKWKKTTEVIELPNLQRIRTLGEKKNYKYLGILEADTIKQVEMKEKVKKEYIRQTRKVLENKLCSRNPIKGINIWAVHFSGTQEYSLKRQRRTQTNGSENKKIDQDAQGITPETEETCCHLDSSERPSANAGMKNLQEIIIIMGL